MNMVFFHDCIAERIENCASAVLSVAACDPAQFQALLGRICAEQQDATVRGRLEAALQRLLAGNTWSLDRASRIRFRNQIKVFMQDVRVFLHTR